MTNLAIKEEFGTAPEVSPGPIGGPAAWRGPDMAKSGDWIEVLSDAEIAEIDAAIHAHVAQGLSMADIRPETFNLPTVGPRLKRILNDVVNGRGFVLLRGFPVDRYSVTEAAIGYLGIGSHIGSFRPSNAKGHLLGHVRDIGLDITKPTTRYSQTHRGLEFHTDSVDIVGLLCLKTAKSGGASRIVSSVTLHDVMYERRPDLWRALFNAFPTDRRGEIPPGMKPWFEVPVFNWYDGHLTTIYAGQYIRSAQELFPEARRLTDVEIEALAYLDTLCNDPEFCLSMDFLPGDIQLLHNHQILHAREDYEDWPEEDRKRHLLRLWLSPEKGRALPPSFAARYGSLKPGSRGGIFTEGTKLTFSLSPV